LLVGGVGADKSKKAWAQVYRALDHGTTKNACLQNDVIRKFPKSIEDFANVFVTLQKKRHDADYDPFSKFTKTEVLQDIATVEQAIFDFGNVNTKDRRAFCAFVLFKKRT
jgi:disulfide oxidoreductase YuzD